MAKDWGQSKDQEEKNESLKEGAIVSSAVGLLSEKREQEGEHQPDPLTYHILNA